MSICYSQPLAVTVAPEEKIDKITIESSMQTVQRHSQPLAVTARVPNTAKHKHTLENNQTSQSASCCHDNTIHKKHTNIYYKTVKRQSASCCHCNLNTKFNHLTPTY
jgi:hypothetical protein